MAIRVKPDTGEVSIKQRYRVTNWPEYDRTLFQLPRRATARLINPLMRLCHLDLRLPDHTHPLRGDAEISVKIPRRLRKGPTHVVVDSTGLKILGEGEWAEAGLREAALRAARAGRLCKADCGRVRQHGVGKRRPWRKVHLAVDESTKNTIGVEVATTAWCDSEILPGLLDQVEGEIAEVSADGAYDSHGCHAAIAERDARATLPSRDAAVTWGDAHTRDAIVQGVEAKGLDGWKNDSGYRRSIAENMLYRPKQLGASLYSRTFERQVSEGMSWPQSVRAGKIVCLLPNRYQPRLSSLGAMLLDELDVVRKGRLQNVVGTKLSLL